MWVVVVVIGDNLVVVGVCDVFHVDAAQAYRPTPVWHKEGEGVPYLLAFAEILRVDHASAAVT